MAKTKVQSAADATYQFCRQHFWVILLFVLALVVRAYRFGSVPGGFNQDEAMAAYDAYMVARYGMDRFEMRLPILFTSWGIGHMSAFLLYAMVPFFWIFGLTVTAARLPILIFSMLGLFAMYKFTDDVFESKPIALAVLAFGAINPWHIMQSRWALDCNMFPHLMMIGAWMLYRGLKAVGYEGQSTGQQSKRKGKNNNKKASLKLPFKYNAWLAGSMIFFALCLYAYGIAMYAVPMFLLLMTIYLLIVDRSKYAMPLLISVGVFLIVAWPILTVMAINFFELRTIRFLGFTLPFFPYTARTDDLIFFSQYPLRQLGWNARSLGHVLLQQNDLHWNVIPGHGTLFMWSIPFTSLGLFHMLGEKKNMGKVVLLFWFLVSLLTGLVVRGVNVNRINVLFYPLIILTGVGLYYTVMLAKTAFMRKLVVATLIFISALSFGFFTRNYFGEHNRQLSSLFFEEFLDGVDIAQDIGYDRLYVTNFLQSWNQWHLTEILLLFGAQVEPTLFWDTHAFRDTYRFSNFDNIPHPPEEGVRTLYLFNSHEAHFFPAEMFNITWGNGFGVAEARGE